MNMKAQIFTPLLKSILTTAICFLGLIAPTKIFAQSHLIDIDFGAGTSTSEVGFAATGQSTTDFWNFYTRDDGHGGYLNFGSLTNLKYADGTASGAGFTIANAAGCYGNGAADWMYVGYLYPSSSGNIVVTLTNLAAGSYDFYLYGHGNVNNQNSGFKISVGGQTYGPKTNLNGPGWNSSAVWQEGLQYVKFPGVLVGSGQTIILTVSPASSSYAILSGIQIMQSGPAQIVAPTITSQPVNSTVTVGTSAHFTVGVAGSAPLAYQWFLGSVPLPGATSATLTLASAQALDAGIYSVTVSNSAGIAISSNAFLTVNPVVVSTNVFSMIDVQFCALANTGGLAVRKTGIAAAGISASDYWNAYSRDGANGEFLNYGELDNLALVDGTPSGVNLTVANAPGAWYNGTADAMYATYLYPFDGKNIVVSLSNLNTGSYDFYIYGHGSEDNQNSTYLLTVDGQSFGSQSTTDTASWNSISWQQGVQYVKFQSVAVASGQSVVITAQPDDSSYAVISGLQIAQVTALPPVAPTITTQPASQTVTAGANVNFAVGANGTRPFYYQWAFAGNAITGATNATLSLSNVQTAAAGNYAVTVSNSVGSATSSNALLTVNPVVYKPVANSQTISLIENTSVPLTLTGSISNGGTLAFTVLTEPTNGTLTGTAPNLTYQPTANFSGSDSFTFQTQYGIQTSAVATVSINVLTQNAGPLIDVAFGAGVKTSEAGFAATGQTTNDFWNFYSRDDTNGNWKTFGCLTNLEFVDGTASTASLTISNAPGCWGNGSSDPMYNSYLYPFDGGKITLTVSNLATGSYSFYVYGHGNTDNQYSIYQLTIDGQTNGFKTNSLAGWNSPAWQENAQYVKFSGVAITNGQVVQVTVLPGAGGYAVLSGIQMAQNVTTSGATLAKVGKQQSLLSFSPATNTVPAPMLSSLRKKGFHGLTFAGVIGHNYRIEVADSPVSPTWTPIAVVTVDRSPFTFTDPDSTVRAQRFYRVVVLP